MYVVPLDQIYFASGKQYFAISLNSSPILPSVMLGPGLVIKSTIAIVVTHRKAQMIARII